MSLVPIVALLYNANSVTAQADGEKSGKLVGGHSDVIPIQISLGQMIEGNLISPGEPLEVTIENAKGKKVQDYGSIKNGSFSYAAPENGEYYLIIANPNAITVRAREYTITWTIIPTVIQPSTGTGDIKLWDRIISFLKPIFLWAIVVLFLLVLVVAPGRDEKKEELELFYYSKRIIITIEEWFVVVIRGKD